MVCKLGGNQSAPKILFPCGKFENEPTADRFALEDLSNGDEEKKDLKIL